MFFGLTLGIKTVENAWKVEGRDSIANSRRQYDSNFQFPLGELYLLFRWISFSQHSLERQFFHVDDDLNVDELYLFQSSQDVELRS